MSSFVAFLSGADQYGRWVPEAEVTASAYLGGSTVDFSQALFKHPATWAGDLEDVWKKNWEMWSLDVLVMNGHDW